jgi:hypothetical protein
MAGRANSEDRTAGFPVGADELHLLFREIHPSGEDQQEVCVLQRIQVLQDLTAVGAPRGRDGDAVMLFDVGQERFQGGLIGIPSSRR